MEGQDLGRRLNETCLCTLDGLACLSRCSFNKASPVMAFASVSLVHFLASFDSSTLSANLAELLGLLAGTLWSIPLWLHLTRISRTGSSISLRHSLTCEGGGQHNY